MPGISKFDAAQIVRDVRNVNGKRQRAIRKRLRQGDRDFNEQHRLRDMLVRRYGK